MQPESAPLEMLAPAMSATSARPSAHTQKYDRQLRLWASTGQAALENASLLFVGASATAASTLKNLVLPGIGNFTIMDPLLVSGADVGNNFFLERSSIGKSRAVEVVRYLSELNSDVSGTGLVDDVARVLREDPASLEQYSLIVAVDLDPTTTLALADFAWEKQIDFIKVKSCGFYGVFRVQVREITIVETHPESLIDLRIQSPWEELLALTETFEYGKMDSMEHGHIPAVIILVKALLDWRASHNGAAPISSVERKEFTKYIQSLKRTSDEENFDEAVDLFRRAGVKPDVPQEIEALFNDPACKTILSTSTNFWLLLRALRQFVHSAVHSSSSAPLGLLPLSGVLPDMKASSTQYVSLQNVFRTKAKVDLERFGKILQDVLQEVGGRAIGQEEVESFVKHGKFLLVVRGRSLRMEQESSLLKGRIAGMQEAASYSEVLDESLDIYLAFLVAERFQVAHGRYPGTLPTEDGTMDLPAVTIFAGALLAELEGGAISEQFQNVLAELCRAGSSDLPQIAALVGGLVSQEAIKLVTRQYVPLLATGVWNGVRASTGVIQA